MSTTKLFPITLVSLPLLCLALPACGAGSGGRGASTSTHTDPVVACSGSYVCTDGTDSVTTSLQRQDGTCYLGQVEMDPGGKAVNSDGSALSWYGDSQFFGVCASDGCFQCTSQSTGGTGGTGGSSSPVPTHQKSCQGTAESCPSSPPCYVIEGCQLQIGYDAFGNPDDSCSGEPRSCDSIGDQSSCEAQGCSWQ